MDLVAGVRKEGSRGGRDAFKWEDVKDDQHRENYLGHSLMAPVGRWQKNKDLSWYAKGDSSQAAVDAAQARAEEIRRIKEAEQDALSEALGFKVEPRLQDHQVAGPKEVERAIREAAEGEEEGGKGVGFGVFAGGMATEEARERMVGNVGEKGGLEGLDRKREKRRRRSRSRSRSRDARREHHRRRRANSSDRDHESHHRDRDRDPHARRSHRAPRTSSRDRHPRSRPRGYERNRPDERAARAPRERSYSPRQRHRRVRERERGET